MNDPRTAEATAIKLAELSHEIDELETNRVLLLKRVDAMRAALLSAGNRTTAMRASVDLLCEHITNVAIALTELRALEEEINEIGQGLAGNMEGVSNLSFESESLSETLDEAEDELERLSSILIDGKKRNPRGH